MTQTKGNRYEMSGLELSGWTSGDGSGSEGYNAADYFRGGRYLGPDEHGIEPEFRELMNNTARPTEGKEFYFRVFEDGDAMVMVIDHNGNYSQHLSTDETEGDGDGATGPYHWNDAQAWSKTTREHAESMLKFNFTDLEG